MLDEDGNQENFGGIKMKGKIPIVLGFILVGGLLAGCRVNAEEGHMTTREFNLTDFNKVEVGGAFQVEISQSDTFNVSVTADDFPHIRVEKSGDTLIIRRQGIEWFAPFHAQPRAKVTLPKLVELTVSGASKGTFSNFQSTDDLAVTVSGASHVEAVNIAAGYTTVEVSGAATLTGNIKSNNDSRFEISGASHVELTGGANNLKAKVSGASRVDLGQFPVQNADVEVSGASNGTINLNGKLDANVSGASNLYWSGTPIMGDIQTSGASNLRRK